MLRTNWKTAVFTVAGLGLAAPTQGDQISDMQAQIDALRAELSTVKSDKGDNWLNERRAEEVKGLIMEVLSDADMRASLAGDGAVAGHDGKNFFVGSVDGGFLMKLSGQLQFRYIYNNQDVSSGDEDEGGFQSRRIKVAAAGHISSPKVGYKVQLARESSSQDMLVDEFYVSHQLSDNLKVYGGKIKLPFLREELVSSKNQLAAERSTTNEFFTLNRAEGVRLTYDDGPLTVNVMVSDGGNSGLTEFDADMVEVALTGRVDYQVSGEKSQLKDFTGWSGEEQALGVGAAIHHALGDGQNGGTADYTAWTLDAQFENGPFNLFGAYTAGSIDPDASGASDRDMDGFVVQGGVHIVPDKAELFARWSYIDGDVSGEDEFDAFTLGMNYYINGHRTKFTADVIWLEEDLPTSNPYGANAASNGLGLITGTEDEMAVRTQIQVLF